MSQYLTPGQGTHFQWIVEGQILLLDMKTDPGPDAFLYDQMVVDQCNFAKHSLDLIVQVPPTTSANAINPLMSFKSCQHPRLGSMTIVGFKTSMTTLRGAKVQSFDTLDEALNFLQS